VETTHANHQMHSILNNIPFVSCLDICDETAVWMDTAMTAGVVYTRYAPGVHCHKNTRVGKGLGGAERQVRGSGC
jgi:hypothetical protein